MTIQDICESFDIAGKYLSCTELFTGNINNTYKVDYYRDGETKSYVVQRINTNVFREPEKLMDNIVGVTEYIREHVAAKGLSTKRYVVRVFLTKDGNKPYFIDNNGNYWRVYRYISGSVSYDSSEDLGVIEEAGRAFGRFQNCLSGYDVSRLYEPLPDFHNTVKRYEQLKTAIEKDEYNHVESVKKEIEDVLSFKDLACTLQNLLSENKIPLRVTHNDTKCNNVAFDKETNKALAVLDLDTVMPGLMAYDYGDAIRSIASTALEDDPDLDDVKLDLNKVEAFTVGFLGEVKNDLTDTEKKYIDYGIFSMTVELAVRFLTDYIDGDKYFKIKYPGHNLDRARNQIALAKDILRKRKEIVEIIDKYLY